MADLTRKFWIVNWTIYFSNRCHLVMVLRTRYQSAKIRLHYVPTFFRREKI